MNGVLHCKNAYNHIGYDIPIESYKTRIQSYAPFLKYALDNSGSGPRDVDLNLEMSSAYFENGAWDCLRVSCCLIGMLYLMLLYMILQYETTYTIPGARNSSNFVHIPPLLYPHENHLNLIYIALGYTYIIQ